jgi:hypothetical protein
MGTIVLCRFLGAAVARKTGDDANRKNMQGFLAPKTIDSLTKIIPVLDQSKNGWWRIILIALAFGSIAIALVVAHKLDPNQVFEGRKPKHDALCQKAGAGYICN